MLPSKVSDSSPPVSRRTANIPASMTTAPMPSRFLLDNFRISTPPSL